MACIITYKNNKYSQQEFEKYFKNNFNEFINEFLSQDIEGFKEFVNSKSFDKELAQKIQDILEKLYPEIKLNITNNPVWEQGDNIFNQEEYINQVNYRLKVVSALLKLSIPQETKRTRKYGETTKPGRLTIKLNSKEKPYIEINLRKTLRGKGVTDNQIDFIFDYMKSNGIQEISTEQLALELASKYGYSVEVNTATTTLPKGMSEEEYGYALAQEFGRDSFESIPAPKATEVRPTQHYSNLTVPGGTNYTENEISTPLITPSIKGHAQFSTDNGIGWFRSDEQATTFKEGNEEEFYNLPFPTTDFIEAVGDKGSKIRRILEIQSKFQKWRLNFEHKGNKYQILENQPTNKPNVFEDHYLENGKRITGKEYNKIFEEFLNTPTSQEDAFIKLIAKQWETLMIRSIIQNTAKQTITEVQESDVEVKVRELENSGLLKIKCD